MSTSARPRNRRGHAPPRPRSARALPSTGEGGRDSSARVYLRQGRSRPLWFGHPWVYENAIDRVEGDAGPGDVVSLVDHDGRFIGRGFYNPRSQIPVRLCTRQDEPVDAAFFRARIAAARALRAAAGPAQPDHDDLSPDQQRGRRSARPGGRRLRRRGGGADHHAGDRAAQGRDLRRARGRARREDDLRVVVGRLRRAGGLRRRVARGARGIAPDGRRARGRHPPGDRAARRAEDRHVHRPARDAHARGRAGARRARARLLRLRRRLRAAGGARRRRVGDRGRQLGARDRAHREPRRRQRRDASTPSRPTCSASSRPRRRARSISW